MRKAFIGFTAVVSAGLLAGCSEADMKKMEQRQLRGDEVCRGPGGSVRNWMEGSSARLRYFTPDGNEVISSKNQYGNVSPVQMSGITAFCGLGLDGLRNPSP